MDADVPSPAEPAGDAPDAESPAPWSPPEDDDVSAAAEELKRLVDAGASSPEELRALAARIREHRALEESRWRAEVRPALIKSKKRRFSMGDLRDASDEPRTFNGLAIGAGLLAAVLVLLLAATQSSFLWILVPVAAVLVYAYGQGRRAASDATSAVEPPAEDAPD